MINVIQWKKQLDLEKSSCYSGFGLAVIKCPGNPLFLNTIPKTYKQYRLKYTLLSSSRLPK